MRDVRHLACLVHGSVLAACRGIFALQLGKAATGVVGGRGTRELEFVVTPAVEEEDVAVAVDGVVLQIDEGRRVQDAHLVELNLSEDTGVDGPQLVVAQIDQLNGVQAREDVRRQVLHAVVGQVEHGKVLVRLETQSLSIIEQKRGYKRYCLAISAFSDESYFRFVEALILKTTGFSK